MLNSKRFWTTTIFLGIAFDILFWDKAPGISFPLFIILVLLSGVLLLGEAGIRPNKRALGLLLPVGFFATMSFVRAEPLTTFLNYLLAFVFLAFFALTYLGGRWASYSLADYVAGFFRLFGSAVGRPLSFITETRKQREQTGDGSGSRNILPVIRGLLIALPVVAIFAGLLSSADLIFAQRMENFVALFRLEKLPEYIFRGILILIVAYALVGIWLYAAQKSRDETLIGEEKPVLAPFLGFTEASIVLGSVLILFGAFVLVQFQYFFGGQANINLTGYTYAEYARRGFGELVMVAVFSLFLFLGLSAVTRRETQRVRRTFSGMGITLVMLVLVMLVSAYQRLLLYEAAYGFSRLRTYPHVFMIWLGALLLAVVALEIMRKQRSFALAMSVAIVGFAATLNLLNVDAFIVTKNIARSSTGVDLDVAYLSTLSDDAVSPLAGLRYQEGLPNEIREAASAALICHWYENEYLYTESHPWQSFHLARWKASQIYGEINPLDGYTIDRADWNMIVTSPSGVEFDCHDREIWD